MNPQDALLDRAPEAAVRTLALALLDEAATAAEELGSDDPREALHDFRVALRRLRTLFKSYAELLLGSVSKKQARALRELAAATGGARDAEVQLAWLAEQRERLEPQARHAWSWMVERLEARRRAAYSGVRDDVLQRFTALEARLRRGLSRYEARVVPDEARTRFAGTAAETVRSTGTALVAALEAVRAPTDVEGAHQARIQGKRLRYLIEPLRATSLEEPAERLVGSIKELQDVLGKLHDVHVLADEIAAALVEEATARARLLHQSLYSNASPPPGSELRSGLLAIDRRVRDRVEALFEELRAGWSGATLATFAGDVEALSSELRRHGSRATRRRFLLASLPALDATLREARAIEIIQGWIPGLSSSERLERVTAGGAERFYLVRNGTGRELEEEANREVFERLWSLTEGRQVRKCRYRIAEGAQLWEVDEFLEHDLVTAETERHGPLEPVELPGWLRPHVVREVTGEGPYLDENLAR